MLGIDVGTTVGIVGKGLVGSIVEKESLVQLLIELLDLLSNLM